MVYGCMAIATISWSLALFGPSVYLQAIHESTGLSIGLVSSAITSTYLFAAVLQLWVGSAVQHFGPRVALSFGALALAGGVAGLGFVSSIWHAYAAFLALGVGWAFLSTTALTTTLAPWFELHQGKAASTALLGASVGGMLGVPLLLLGITHIGLRATVLCAALIALTVIIAIATLVLRHRPQDMGLLPDGQAHADAAAVPASRPQSWTRGAALRTIALRTVMLGFGVGLLVQIGFLTHHVALLLPTVGAAGAAATVTATAIAAFIGRIGLARYSDHVDVRQTTFGLMLVGAVCLSLMALFPSAWVLVGLSVVYGLTIGNITTLGPIIVRREFGAASFGKVYGTAATGIQLMSAMGPVIYGALYDQFRNYSMTLLLAATLNILAALVIVYGARHPLVQASPDR